MTTAATGSQRGPGTAGGSAPSGFAGLGAGGLLPAPGERELRWQLALAAELESAIGRFPGVERVRVFLVDPGQRRGFERTSGRAVVSVHPEAGAYLGVANVDAIRRLVGGAVSQLSPDDVTVIDERAGRALDVPTGLNSYRIAQLEALQERERQRLAGELGRAVSGWPGVQVQVMPDASLVQAMLLPGAQPQAAPGGPGSPGSHAGPGPAAMLADALLSDETYSPPFSTGYTARLVVPAEVLAQFMRQERLGPVEGRQRLSEELRRRVSSALPTLAPEALELQISTFEPGPPEPERGGVVGWMAAIGVVCAAAGYVWGRPYGAAAGGGSMGEGQAA